MAVLVTVDAELARLPGQILGELRRQATTRLLALARAALPFVRHEVRRAMMASQEASELVSGRLRVEFGIENGTAAVNSIIDAIEASVRVEVVPGAGEFLGGLFIGAFRDDFSDALSADGARYDSVNASGRILPIEWLSWLLFAGDAVVISDYGLFGGADPQYSRTGRHIMVKRKEGGKLSPWRVPPAYAGTTSDNWLSRCVEQAAPGVLRFLEAEARRLI